MDTLIVVLADRLPVPRCYDANHHNTSVFKVGSNEHARMHTHFINLQFVVLTEIICRILNVLTVFQKKVKELWMGFHEMFRKY